MPKEYEVKIYKCWYCGRKFLSLKKKNQHEQTCKKRSGTKDFD